jgi:hypothetical protein
LKESKSIAAVGTSTSLNSHSQTSIQPLEQDVVCLSSTPTETESLLLKLKCAIALLDALSGNVLSGDAWAISLHQAATYMLNKDEDPDAVHDAFKSLMESIERRRKANPLSGMF